jgi:GNAT superfamily N-acetyltransferase
MYSLHEVDGGSHADTLHQFNAQIEEWPPLSQKHIFNGHWWISYLEDEPVAFAGLVPFEPFVGVGYLKRCFVKPDHHGHGLQFRMLMAREIKAKHLGWTMLVSECSNDNLWSAANFRKAGYQQTEPEQPWAKDSIYWVKHL